ncbi:MAG: sulfurtransferase TusA family protein [Pelotomaculum sp.]
MQEVKDARGLLCPEPLLMVKNEMERLGGKGTIKVLVDSAAARDNISRLSQQSKMGPCYYPGRGRIFTAANQGMTNFL